jgi:hypothetical protein
MYLLPPLLELLAQALLGFGALGATLFLVLAGLLLLFLELGTGFRNIALVFVHQRAAELDARLSFVRVPAPSHAVTGFTRDLG